MGVVRDYRNRFFKYAVGKKRVLKYVLRALPDEFSKVWLVYDDHEIIVDPKTSFGIEVAQRGLWHRQKIRTIQSLVAEKHRTGTVLELGANVGTESIALILEGYDRVVAVEPDPDHIQSLNRNIEINDLGDKISVVNAAVGQREGTGTFNRSEMHPSANSLVWARHDASAMEIKIYPANTILEMANTSLEEIRFVWMDVEGFELEALKSMSSIMQAKIPMFFEYTGHVHDTVDVETMIKTISGHYENCYFAEIENAEIKKADFEDIRDVKRQIDILVF